MIEQTYPSGRVVKNTFDENGDLSQVQSRKCGDSPRGTSATCASSDGYWQYAGAFAYDKNGALTKFQLGNGRWETYSYNNRQQLTMIGLGATDSTQDQLKLEYRYGVWSGGTLDQTKNNSALAEQKITVPTVGSNSGFTATQVYNYDALNRITSATETVASSQTWKQEFSYDQFGNKNFVTGTGHTTTLGSCSTAVCNPTISTSTNRITTTGYAYDASGSITVNASGERFAYDAENHQVSFFLASNGGSTPDAAYVYDGDGRRVKKTSSLEATVFVYDAGGKLVAEYSSAPASTQQVSYLTGDIILVVRE